MSKKGRITSIRFSDEEHARIAARATAARMAFGEYVRRCGLHGHPEPLAPLPPPLTRKAPVTPATPATHAESLDTLGDDPLRGGQHSNRR